MKLEDLKFSAGCCGNPPQDYAEVSLADGGVLKVTREAGSPAYVVTRFGPLPFAEKQMASADLDALIQSDAGGLQIYV